MVTEEQSIKEYEQWEKFLETEEGKGELSIWDHCPEDCMCECDGCIWNLVGLEEMAGEFLERVKAFVENTVEEFYMHPNWTPEEVAEYGVAPAYLVDVYFRNNLEAL